MPLVNTVLREPYAPPNGADRVRWGLAGGLLAAATSGPPGFIVYLATTLVAVAVLFYNVNALVDRKLSTLENGR